jgi:hypothetical protein
MVLYILFIRVMVANSKNGALQAVLWGVDTSYNTAFTKLAKMKVV